MFSNLEAMLAQADANDVVEGQLAYVRYHQVMCTLAQRYSVPLPRVVAAFVSLSPNNDYAGNLRSTVSVLAGRYTQDDDAITVSTYKHCRTRALQYVRGQRDFLREAKGPKITNFYHNILTPDDSRWVTIDGHMVAAWKGQRLVMKQALCTLREYREIAAATKALAFQNFMLPNQVQAIIWFARKRTLHVKYNGQLNLFGAKDDVWNTLKDVTQMKPYSIQSSGFSSRTTSSGSMEMIAPKLGVW